MNAAVMFYFCLHILAYNRPASLIRNRLERRQTKSKNKQDSNSERLPNISNTDVSIFLMSQHNEPNNSTVYSHLQVGTNVFFPQIIFADAEQFAI